ISGGITCSSLAIHRRIQTQNPPRAASLFPLAEPVSECTLSSANNEQIIHVQLVWLFFLRKHLD
ncbi:hypothetical protein, partial [Ileibacterium valens]